VSRFPAVFVSHGATLALEDIEANRLLRGVGEQLGRLWLRTRASM